MPGDEDEEEDLIETVRGAPDRASGPGAKPTPVADPATAATKDEDEEDEDSGS